MNSDIIQGKWKQIKGQVKQKWGELTDDELDQIDGKRDELVGKIQEHYGIAKDEAEEQVNQFESSCHC
ncbi:CsbD family protein [Gimesia chilikensis]|mgnify:CR=1 FL=1|uniref:CsbD family protein n=1 Tax=Gimesia chilikensis TaxID=2605989 RepID=UPI003A9392B6